MRRIAYAAGLLLLPTMLFCPVRAEDKLAPRKIDNFTLADVDGKDWSLNAVKEKKAIVVVFIGLECPISNAYAPVLSELNKKYGKDVQFVAINANARDTPAKIKGHAKEHHLDFPVLK